MKLPRDWDPVLAGIAVVGFVFVVWFLILVSGDLLWLRY